MIIHYLTNEICMMKCLVQICALKLFEFMPQVQAHFCQYCPHQISQ